MTDWGRSLVVTMIWDYGRGCGVEDVVGARYQVTMIESGANRSVQRFTTLEEPGE